ncbi:MAG: hypothetical protein KGR98_02240 [Verrucomicrobia bacterium]|nr:hypothetical protein [Verrucomicrobiota bacterium]
MAKIVSSLCLRGYSFAVEIPPRPYFVEKFACEIFHDKTCCAPFEKHVMSDDAIRVAWK